MAKNNHVQIQAISHLSFATSQKVHRLNVYSFYIKNTNKIFLKLKCVTGVKPHKKLKL